MNVAGGLMAAEADLAQLKTALIFDLVGRVILIASAVFFIGTLRSITANLWRRAGA